MTRAATRSGAGRDRPGWVRTRPPGGRARPVTAATAGNPLPRPRLPAPSRGRAGEGGPPRTTGGRPKVVPAPLSRRRGKPPTLTGASAAGASALFPLPFACKARREAEAEGRTVEELPRTRVVHLQRLGMKPAHRRPDRPAVAGTELLAPAPPAGKPAFRRPGHPPPPGLVAHRSSAPCALRSSSRAALRNTSARLSGNCTARSRSRIASSIVTIWILGTAFSKPSA